MNRITNEQREAIVRKAIAERDALLSAQRPALAMDAAPATANPDGCEAARSAPTSSPTGE